jgi:hypothetical protein
MQAALVPLYDQTSNATDMAVTTITLAFSCVTIIYSIALGLVMPIVYARYADTGQLGEAFKLGYIFSMLRAAPSAYLIVLLGSILAGFAASLGVIACFIGIIFTAVLAMAVNGHLYGQAYNIARGTA